MVRETRHLWVGNLPDNIREDRIREHFKRYGRVQSVKIFSRKGGECDGNGLVVGCGASGMCATVSFMDIKSASKAHNTEHKLDEHLLTTEYHEPAPIPSTPAASAVPPSVSAGGSPVTQATPTALRHPPPYSSPRFTHGPTEDITTFDRSSHFYERRDGTENYVRRPPSTYHVVSPSESLRGRTRERDRLYRNGPPHYTPILERTPPTHHRTVTTTSWNSYESTSCSRYPSSVVTTPEILSYQEERRESTPVIIVHKKHPKSRRKCRVMPRCGSNGSESVSNNSDSSRSRSHSSSSSSHSRSSSSSSDSSSAAISERSCSTHSHHGSLKSTVTVHSTISTPLTNCSPVVHTDDRRPLAICIRNLPARSSDSSVKDGLYHEYKKHGKVTHVKIVGQGANRYAIVCFKKADDVDKAIQLSHDKLLFGSKIEVTVYHGYDIEDTDFRPVEAELDEYHPKATRTLFIGNLEKDITVNDLRNTFQKFGEIIDIDIRKQGTTCYAFCQYCDISSVVKAMHAMDGEYLGNNKINLGYGKSLATNCLWVAGVADCVTEKQLIGSFSQFGHVTHVDINRSQGKALVFFQQTTHAQAALSQMRGYNLKNRRLMADYASLECQENFYEHYEKSKSTAATYENNCQDSPRSTGSTRGLDTPVSSTSSNSGNVSKHSMSSISNSNNSCTGSNANNNNISNLNNSSSNNNNNNNNNNSGNSCKTSSSRFQHTLSSSSSRTTPTHQPVQQTPSSNSASPIVNNTPSPSPSTSSRSTPRPQQTSRFDYSSSLECNTDRRISRSYEDLSASTETSEKPAACVQDDVTLQKERVSLLEQLNDYSSSEDEEEEEELASIKQQNALRQQRSTSREESRPGTPLCDERPENILAHYESRRAAKEKNTNNTPLSLPLPSFANKVPRSTSPTERSSKSPHLSKSHTSRSFDGLRNSSLSHTRQSPSSHVKDKSNILDSKLSSITSFDSLTETLKEPWIEQLKSLQEKYEKWSGSRSKVLTGKLDTSAVQTKHKLLDVNSIGRQRSEICQTVLSRKSVFDDHFKRLETSTDQPSNTEFIPPRVTVNNTTRSHSIGSAAVAAATLPNLCSKPLSTNNVSSLVMKGLQYPFPSHPPIKSSTLPKISPTFPKTLPETLQSSTTSGLSDPRTSLLLRNNSVEKLTELPKTTPVAASRESLNRLDLTCHETKKEVSSPASSRRNSIENASRRSLDEETKKPAEPKTPLEPKTKFNSVFEACKATEKENSVLDKRKNSLDRSQSESCNAVSVIFHTSQKEKLSKSLEDMSEVGKVSRRSSIESSADDDRLSETKTNERTPTETVNHTKVKISDTRPDAKTVRPTETKRDTKNSKLELPDEENKLLKTVPFNHIDDVKDLDKKKEVRDEKRPKEIKSESLDDREVKTENVDSKGGVLADEDDEDSNDVDDNKTLTVKNKIIETVFHIKHEKKKSESKTEISDEKNKLIEKRKSISEQPCKLKESSESKKEQNGDSKSKKECIKTKEFNMFENKPSDKKKNHFLSEPRKSVEMDSKDESLKNLKRKDKEVKENVEVSGDRAKTDKKKEKQVESKHKDVEKRKSEEKREEPKPISADSDKHRSDGFEKKHETHKSEPRKEMTAKPKEPEKEMPKEKKKEKVVGQPENGKVKHHDYKKYKELESHKLKPVEKEIKTETTDAEKSVEKSFHKNKVSHEILKSLERHETSKERKNSSGSSSLSDSVPSKGKLSSFDSLESNNEEKSRHDSVDHDSHVSKKFDKHKNNSSAADTNSGKEEKKGEGRSKKLDKNGSSNKRKKSKKRKTLSDSNSDSEFESYDENKMNNKNHSIFDVVLDEPAYISMYDKVKARSTKNLQKQEEEKRQQKLKEKFNQLKQSRVKREEKKRSTSYDDDTDHEPAVPRKGNKLVLDSSDEEHSGAEKMKDRVQTDSSDEERDKKKVNSGGESETKTKYKTISRRSSSSKNKDKLKPTLTDTSEDEMKSVSKREHRFALMKEKEKRLFKNSMLKKLTQRPSKRKSGQKKKTESEASDDEKRREESKSYFDGGKLDAEKIYSDFSDDDVKTKLSKSLSEEKLQKQESGLSEDNSVKKTKPKNDLKTMIEKGELNKVNNFNVDSQKSKLKLLISDISEEEEVKPNQSTLTKMKKTNFVNAHQSRSDKLLSDTSENESIKSCQFQRKMCNIYSEDSELDVTIKREEKTDELFYNLAELHNDYDKSENSSPPPLLNPMVYDGNDFQKKKSHKKKQKRQKSREDSIDRIKKHSKKERRKSVPSDVGDEEGKDKEHKQKKKKKSRNKMKSVESLEEDIFGSMSDDSEKMNEPTQLSKMSVSDVYDADSDSSNKDVRETETNSVDAAKFGKTNNVDLELKLLNSDEKMKNYDNYFEHMKSKKKKRKKSKDEKSSKHHHPHHHHRHNHHHEKSSSLSLPCLDDVTPTETPAPNQSQTFDFDTTKEKPKDEEPNDAVGKRKSMTEAVDILTSSIAKSISEEKEETKTQTTEDVDETAIKSIANAVEQKDDENIHDRAVQSIAPTVNENIHDRAVMSISNVLAEPTSESADTPIRAPVDEKLKTNAVDDKTGGTISQEETEDAVAAILGDSSEFGFGDCFSDEAMKPETPGSDHDLLIDTDTEDTSIIPSNKNDTEATNDITVTSSEESFVTVCDKTPNVPEPPKITPLADVKDSLLDDYAVSSANNSVFATPRELTPEKELHLLPKKLDVETTESKESAGADESEQFVSDVTAKIEEAVHSELKSPAAIENAVVSELEKPSTPNVSEETSNLNMVKEVTEVPTVPEERVTSVCSTAVITPQPETAQVVIETIEPAVIPKNIVGEDVKIKEIENVAEKSNFNFPAESEILVPPTPQLPNNLTQMNNLLHDETVFKDNKSPSARNSPIKEISDVEKDVKRRERKRSYVKCNGPTSLTVEEQQKVKPCDSPDVTTEIELPKEFETVESDNSRPVNEELPEPNSTSLTEEKSVSAEPPPEILKETENEEKPSTVVDHTNNSIVNKEPNVEVPETSIAAEICNEPATEVSESSKSAVEAYRSVMLDCIGESQSNKEKDDVPKSSTLEDTTPSFLNAEKIGKNEPDALKQKLPIPAQQNTELTDSKDLPASNTEANEANKENIVKSVNDFSKCNHKVPNILEKVVQRIHESKRIIQKTEEYVSSNTNLTPINLNDKVALVTEEEITSAEILLKMSETGIVKNQVTDYNCVIKVDEETKLESKIDEKETSFESKNDSFSSTEGHNESTEEAAENTEDVHQPVETGTKFVDHCYNAKRGRRRKTPIGGGVVTRRGKQNNVIKETEATTNYKIKKSSTDVYEFKEDSEEEVKRPRLILTIKSPAEQSQPPVVQITNETPVITEAKTTSPSTLSTISPVTPKSSTNTRKSRRLQEKEGGSRSSLEDTPEKAAKVTVSPRPTRRTTRIAAQAATAIITTVHESTRKNTRGGRKSVAKLEATQPLVTETPPSTAADEDDDEFPASPAISSASSTSPSNVVPSSPVSARISTEPTNLIDPVSGLLIPMKEAEEGQYVPALTELTQSRKTPDYPPEKKARWDDSVEESAISLVKSDSATKSSADVTVATSVITSTIPTSVIAPVPNVTVIKPQRTSITPKPTIEISAPSGLPSNTVAVEDGPISLIKTTTASIITPAAAMKSHTAHTAAYNPSFSSMVYSQTQSVTKLHSAKTVVQQPRVLTPITPKAHIMQALNSENENHSSDEVPYPPQYSSPLLHGAVASPPLSSPKISPQPVVSGANNSRVAHTMKNLGPLEPLKIDPTAGYYYMPNTSPQSRPALAVQSPSPQPRIVHAAPALNPNLPHYIHPPQFIYQPYMQEPSLTPYHLASQSPAAATTKIIADRDIIDARPAPVALSVTPSPPLELRKKGSPRPRVTDSPLITSPYVQNNRAFYYDEPLQPHRPLQNRIRVSTPPYAAKVQPADPVDMFVPTQPRLHLETPGFARHVPAVDETEESARQPPTTAYTADTAYIGPIPLDTRITAECELDYSRRSEIALCDGAVPRSRDSPPSQMDSPPLGDSPPQGNQDGTVLLQMYPIIWQGLLALKNDQAAVQMHVLSGNRSVAYDALPKLQDGYQPLLRIAQRMRLEQAQLDGVHRKMEIKNEHCTILGLPCGKNQEDVVQQATNLESCIIPYLQQKKAAGIINTAAPGTQQAAFVVHVFPPCEFADNVLLNEAPDLYRKVQETAYLVCIIVTV